MHLHGTARIELTLNKCWIELVLNRNCGEFDWNVIEAYWLDLDRLEIEIAWIEIVRHGLCWIALILACIGLNVIVIGLCCIEGELGWIELRSDWIYLCWLDLTWRDLNRIDLGWIEKHCVEIHWIGLGGLDWIDLDCLYLNRPELAQLLMCLTWIRFELYPNALSLFDLN